MISVAVLIILLGIIAVIIAKRKGKHKTDYYSLFVMGAIWVPFGLIISYMEPDTTIGNIFFILGWIYFVIGIANKDKWKKDRRLIQPGSRGFWWIIIMLGLLVLLGLVAFLFYS